MPIKKDMSGTPKGGYRPRSLDLDQVPDAQRIIPAAVMHWWASYSTANDFDKPMSIEDREFRASWAWMRCDRGLWYLANKEPETEPSGVAAHWRMAIGTAGHEIVQPYIRSSVEARAKGVVVGTEVPVDLRPIGLNGAATADVVVSAIIPEARHYSDGDSIAEVTRPIEVMEIKTMGGFSFKTTATKFKGGPSGPKWGHVVQGSLAAAALGVPLRIVYLSLEVVSPDTAERSEVSEAGRFSAEWLIELPEVREIAAAEVERINAVLAEPFVPVPQVWDPELPVQPMTVTDTARGAVQGEGPTFGRTWLCGYCPFRSRCVQDG